MIRKRKWAITYLELHYVLFCVLFVLTHLFLPNFAWNLREFGQMQCIWNQKTLGFPLKKNRANWMNFEFQVKYGEVPNLFCFLCGNVTGFCLFKVNNGNTRVMCEKLFRVDSKDELFLTLKRFHTLFWCFHWKCLVNSIELSYIKRWVDTWMEFHFQFLLEYWLRIANTFLLNSIQDLFQYVSRMFKFCYHDTHIFWSTF